MHALLLDIMKSVLLDIMKRVCICACIVTRHNEKSIARSKQFQWLTVPDVLTINQGGSNG